MKSALSFHRTHSRSRPSRAPQAENLLLEIGTEELPAAYLPGVIEQLGNEAKALVMANHLACEEVQAFGTPRRLTLLVRGLSSVQRKPGEDIRGPSKHAAYDQDGKPTPALFGFLRSQGGTIPQTKVVSSDKGDYIYLVKPPTETPTAHVLPSLLPQLIGRLRAPKTMRWDDSGMQFARPIRWLLALYGSTPVRVTCGHLRSAPKTWVGGPRRPRSIAVASVKSYCQALKRAGVILDQRQRRADIDRMVRQAAGRCHGAVARQMLSHGLLDEVTHLVERPVPLVGEFDRRYLELPPEVLLASMAKHQRVFAVESNGKLLSYWVAILEGKPGKPKAVQAVIERILNARLADSLLFWLKDLEEPLQHAKLQGVTFHEKLGSMEEKTQRIFHLSGRLGEMWQLNEQELTHLGSASGLAKADLVKAAVREFPTLQGVMGKYYAKARGAFPDDVAEAIEEHYLPLGGRLPKTLIGSALAILDKYDTLASYFHIGIEPTGDQDPFGLRRAAQGIVEVGWAVHRPLRFRPLFEQWVAAISVTWQALRLPPRSVEGLEERLRRYLLERLYTFAWSKPAPSTDMITAVLHSPCDDLVDAMNRMTILQHLNGHQTLFKAAKVVERTHNILKSATVKQTDVDPERFQDSLERALWDRYQGVKDRLRDLIQRNAYAEATAVYGEAFFEPLHEFFSQVMVNVPEEALQQNRLALMRAINVLYTERIADLSQLAILQNPDPSAPSGPRREKPSRSLGRTASRRFSKE